MPSKIEGPIHANKNNAYYKYTNQISIYANKIIKEDTKNT